MHGTPRDSQSTVLPSQENHIQTSKYLNNPKFQSNPINTSLNAFSSVATISYLFSRINLASSVTNLSLSSLLLTLWKDHSRKRTLNMVLTSLSLPIWMILLYLLVDLLSPSTNSCLSTLSTRSRSTLALHLALMLSIANAKSLMSNLFLSLSLSKSLAISKLLPKSLKAFFDTMSKNTNIHLYFYFA